MTLKHKRTVIKLCGVYVVFHKQCRTSTVRMTVHYYKVQLTLALAIVQLYAVHLYTNEMILFTIYAFKTQCHKWIHPMGIWHPKACAINMTLEVELIFAYEFKCK